MTEPDGFGIGDLVSIKSMTGLDEMNGLTGKIVGVAVRNVYNFYVILLDKPLVISGFEGWTGVVIPAPCLEKLC